MDGLKKGIGSVIPLPYRIYRKKSMLARLEGTKLERSEKGNVPRFLVCSGKVMGREGRIQEKQVIVSNNFRMEWWSRKFSFLMDRSMICDLYCCLPGFMYCMSVTLFLGINWYRVLLSVPGVLPITEQCSLSEKILSYFFSYWQQM